jgi:hypothetical protein
MLQSSNSSDLDNLELDRLLAFLFDDLAVDDNEPSAVDSSNDSTYASLGIFDSFTLSKYDGMKNDSNKEDQGLDAQVLDHQEEDESNALPISQHEGCQDGTSSTSSSSSPTIYIVMTKTNDGSSSSSIRNNIVDLSTPSHSAAGAA